MEEVNTVHSLIPDSDVIKDQPVYQPLLHPPQQVGLVSHHGRGGHADILEIFLSQQLKQKYFYAGWSTLIGLDDWLDHDVGDASYVMP